MGRGALGEAVHQKQWGPGRFRPALREAVRRQAIKDHGSGTYGPA
jgi:hypothetical protein